MSAWCTVLYIQHLELIASTALMVIQLDVMHGCTTDYIQLLIDPLFIQTCVYMYGVYAIISLFIITQGICGYSTGLYVLVVHTCSLLHLQISRHIHSVIK